MPPLTIPTCRIVSDDGPDGYIIINVSDFEPAVHTLYDPPEAHADDPALPGAPDDLTALSFIALRAKAKAMDLSAAGSRADIEQRILDAIAAAPPTPPAPPAAGATAPSTT